MASKWKVWIDPTAFSQNVLKGEEIKKALKDAGDRAVRAAGTGYKSKPFDGAKRAGVTVAPETAEAYYDNLRNNTLLKALRGK